ncbi:alpha-amylase family protein [Olivibacter sp. XZL3]|uniref:alpha-amylase family protein n=1 Tax=Olivibacter sp. XZL3 TaxID=1735116 RepID=UPI001065145C|nr:alpha-amylase family protein [Olivibacter sp. XZL3]
MNKISWLFVRVLFFAFSYSKVFAQDNQPTDQVPWYKNSFFYNIEVGTFKDSNQDGIGDFRGLISELDYLDSLGIDAIWLAPFYPSPRKDDGYDVLDYYGVDAKYGTAADVKEFFEQAHRRGIKIITDVVLNHTSIEHPWFEASRRDVKSPYRDWYVWQSERPKDADKGMVFPGVQKETWTYDSIAQQYYFHRFYVFQPDLNYRNTAVQQEAFKIMRFWLRQGVDGYRLDAVPFIIDIPETGSENPQRMMDLVPQMRSVMEEEKPGALMLGEANLSPEENKDYFGENNSGMQMMFNFYVNQYLFYALASQKIKLLIKAIEETKEKPEAAQWGHFLRNHDEIDLARLKDRQRREVYQRFGPDTTMQLYDRGIRRRLAPMLQNNKQIRFAYHLLFSLPGTPVIRYGEEIGMGDNLELKERLAVRTPMQWSAAPQGGFTQAAKAFRPVIDKGPYSYKNVNVASQLKDPHSLLNFIKSTAALRKEYPEIGLGKFEVLKTNSKYVLAIHYQYKDKSLLSLHNFSDRPQRFKVKGELLKAKQLLSVTDGSTAIPQDITLDGYGFEWYKTSSDSIK